ncbi:hypothetical protein SUDANB145_03952 [Streptomyces sp. enrichment culture]
MSFHKVAPVKKNSNRKAAAQPAKKAAPKKAAPKQAASNRRRPVSRQG